MAPDESAEDQLDLLLAACDEAVAAGKPVDSLVADDTPAELRSRLEHEFAWCRTVRRLLLNTDSDTSPSLATPGLQAATLDPRRLGRFEIRRELGRGGFGVVFLAFDPKLGREVALKVPRPEAIMNPELRARFQREARVAAGLDHPNLVPVYDAGEEGAVCYIASPYCPGTTLSAWLKERGEPAPSRLAARLLLLLADAVEYAHRRGILHRDLKPGNVMLSPLVSTGQSHSGTGADALDFQPRIMDFGLAKVLQDDSEPATLDQRTQSGAIVGTPRYMAPEQAGGQARGIGPATDVHALGAILYELLIGRPPFQGDSAVETLVMVRTQEPVALRRLRPGVPRDLETICLKCLHKDPRKRYASAGALAGDLGRFLNGQPIQARPTPGWERLLKWAQRRPALAALTGVSALALVVVLAVVLLYSVRLQRQRDATEERRREAVASLQKARQAADLMLTRVAEEKLLDVPNMTPLRRRLLEDALQVYQDLALLAGDDPETRIDTARAHKRLAIAHSHLVQDDKAEENFRRSVALLEQLAADFPNVPTYRLELAKGLQNLGFFLSYRPGHRAESEALLRRAIDVQEQLMTANPAEPTYRADLAWTYNNLGVYYSQDAEGKEKSAQAYHKAYDLLSEVVAQNPAVLDYTEKLILVRNNLASVLENSEEVERIHRENVVLLEDLITRYPAHRSYRGKLALSCSNLGGLLAKTGRPGESKQFLRRAVDLRQQLVEESTSDAQPHRFLAMALRALADHCAREGDYAEARRHLERGLAERRTTLKLVPGYPDDLRDFAADCSALAEALIHLGGHAAAAQTAEELATIVPQGARERVNAANLLARCIPLAGEDPKIPEAQRRDLACRYADKAVQLIAEAIRLGLEDIESLTKDPDFEALSTRDDFQKLTRQQKEKK